jgi:hypothetical protein
MWTESCMTGRWRAAAGYYRGVCGKARNRLRYFAYFSVEGYLLFAIDVNHRGIFRDTAMVSTCSCYPTHSCAMLF